MGNQPVELFLYVGLRGQEEPFLMQPLGIERRAGFIQPGNLITQPRRDQLRLLRHDGLGLGNKRFDGRELLAAMLGDPYLAQEPPKSTGRDLFHPGWLELHLQDHAAQAAAVDVQATLTEFTAASCAHAVQRFGRNGRELLVCGGGALNTHLMQRLAALLPGVTVASTAERGLPPLEVEAAAFAWLARQCLLGLPGNRASVTGASGPRVLGAIYPA